MDDPKSNAQPPTKVGGYPHPAFPAVFADGVLSIANSSTVVKFYFARTEPSFAGDGTSIQQAFAQVIMPMDAFVATFAFFEVAINRYMHDGLITADTLEAQRKLAAVAPSDAV